MNLDKFLTVSEAAVIIGKTPQRIRQLINDGQLPAKKVHARLWVLKPKVVADFQKVRRPSGVHREKRNGIPTGRRRKPKKR